MANDKRETQLKSALAYAKSQLELTMQVIDRELDSPILASTKDQLEKFDSNRVHEFWEKACRRVDADPEGAITSARAFFESACKYILTLSNVAHKNDDSLPKLYALTAEALQLLPSQWNEDLFKRILGGAQNVINGIAELRNEYGDAHGKQHDAAVAQPRHARLAVNMVGSIACFFMETWEARLYYNGEALPRWFDDEKNLEIARDLIAADAAAAYDDC
jgi:hypothetical protein